MMGLRRFRDAPDERDMSLHIDEHRTDGGQRCQCNPSALKAQEEERLGQHIGSAVEASTVT